MISDDILLAYLHGTLSLEQLEKVESELENNHQVAQRLQALKDLAQAIEYAERRKRVESALGINRILGKSECD